MSGSGEADFGRSKSLVLILPLDRVQEKFRAPRREGGKVVHDSRIESLSANARTVQHVLRCPIEFLQSKYRRPRGCMCIHGMKSIETSYEPTVQLESGRGSSYMRLHSKYSITRTNDLSSIPRRDIPRRLFPEWRFEFTVGRYQRSQIIFAITTPSNKCIAFLIESRRNQSSCTGLSESIAGVSGIHSKTLNGC